MDDKRRNEIKETITKFRNEPFSDEVLKEYCDSKKIDFISANDLVDYIFQVEHDEKMLKIYPQVLKELRGLSYIPEFWDEEQRKQVMDGNEEVRIRIAQLIEKHELDYRMVDASMRDIAKGIAVSVEMAGTTIFNKASSVLLHIARNKFGGAFNAGHAAKYAEEVYGVKKSWWERTKAFLSNFTNHAREKSDL